MTYGQLRNVVQVRVETILDAITQKQFVSPHRKIDEVLNETLLELGAPVNDSAKVMKRLGLDPATSIGRLRRTEILQLSRTLHRQWRSSSDNTD